MRTTENILVIHTAFLGDLVLTSPVFRMLRKQYPSANIYFLTTPQGKEVMEPNPWQLRYIVYDKKGSQRGWNGFCTIVKEIRKIPFDQAYCFHRYFRSSLLAYLSKAKKIIGFREANGAFFYTKKISRKKFIYEGERYLACLGNYESNDLYPELFFSEHEESVARQLLGTLDEQPYIAIAPSAAWATKRWPVERFAEIARYVWAKYGIQSVVLGGNSEEDLKATGLVVQNFVHGRGVQKEFLGIPLNLGGKTNLGTMKYILSKAKAIVANDSAPLHIGIALSTPVVGIYGPTTKELGFFPLAREGMSAVVETNLYCRPCGSHGHHHCPQAHFRCMLEIPARAVLDKLEPYLCQSHMKA